MASPNDVYFVVTVPVTQATLTAVFTVSPPVILPFAADLVQVDLTAGTAPTVTTLIGNVKQALAAAGTAASAAASLFSGAGRPTIAVGAFVAPSVVAAAPVAKSGQNATYANIISASVPNYAPLASGAAGDQFQVGFDQVGTAGANALFTLTFVKR